MSRHSVRSKMNNDVVDVTVGWDRQLSVFFMDVIKIIESPDDDECETYECEDSIYSGNTLHDLGKFKIKLNDLSIEVPEELFTIVKKDGKQNTGNSYVFYEILNGALNPVNPVG